jgi:hypothetical protein
MQNINVTYYLRALYDISPPVFVVARIHYV